MSVSCAAIDHDTVLRVAATPPINAGNLVAPAPKKQWVTVPVRRGRASRPRPQHHPRRAPITSTRFAELAEQSDDEDDEVSFVEAVPIIDRRNDVASGEEQAASPPIAITDTAKANLRLLTARPKKLRSIPQLVGLKQRERTVLVATQTDRSLCRGPPLLL